MSNGLFIDTHYWFNLIPFLILVRVFFCFFFLIQKCCWVFPNIFSSSFEIIILDFFLLFPVYMCILFMSFLNLEIALYSWDKPSLVKMHRIQFPNILMKTFAAKTSWTILLLPSLWVAFILTSVWCWHHKMNWKSVIYSSIILRTHEKSIWFLL